MKTRTILLFAALAAASTLGCARSHERRPPTLSSAWLSSAPPETAAEHELASGETARALAIAELRAALAPDDPWAHYDRAVALERLARVDDAEREFLEAESRFGGLSRRGEALSLYGRAHLLARAGRCAEAKTVYEAYATFVRSDSPRDAERALRYSGDCVAPIERDPVGEAVAIAVVGGDYARALAFAPAAGGDAWLVYNRAVSLAGLRRTDEAVAAFRRAEAAFGDARRRERSIAVYGRARALDEALRCREAKAAYEEYAALVRETRRADAEMATAYARDCGSSGRR